MRSLLYATCSLLLLLLLTPLASAIYADQAGELDWRVENLGRVVSTVYGGGGRGGQTARAAFVATDARSRAVARIDVKSGAIKWRHVLAPSDAVDAIELTAFGLLSVSGAGKNVRMWDVATGGLLWDNVAYAAGETTAFHSATLVGDDRVLLVTSRAACFVGLKDGVVHWRSPFAAAFDRVQTAALSSDASTLFVVGAGASQVLSVDVTTGAVSPVAGVSLAAAAGAIGIYKSESGEAALVTVAASGGEITVQSLEKTSKSQVWKASNKEDPFVGFESQLKRALVARLASGKRVYARLLDSLAVDVVAAIDSDGVVSESLSDDVTTLLFHAVASSSRAVHVQTFSSSSTSLGWEAEVDVAVHGGAVANAFASCASRKKADSTALRCRALLVMKDDGLVMTTNNDDAEAPVADEETKKNVMWTRDEALANIKEVHWITPAETAIEKQPLKSIPSFVEDLQLDVKRLQQLVQHIVSLSSTLLEEKRQARRGAGVGAVEGSVKPRTEPANAHFFGFSKYIVLLTESGRLFAIRAETKVVEWSVFVGPNYRLFVTRDHPALGAGAELLLVSNSSKLLWIDGDDGRQIESADTGLNGGVWVVLLPKRKHSVDEDATLRRSIALVARDSLDVTILPTAPAGASHPEAENFYFSRFDEVANAFVGYTIDAEAQGGYKARQVWSLVLPADQKVVATSRQRESVVDSSVTVTGDDSLLLKYLNPHMFGVVTQATETLEGEPKSASVLYVSLVDSVTGRVIHRVRHLHGASPVQMTQNENWVVYAFWNTKEKRTEIVSVSMFDGAVGSHSLNLWKRPSWSDFRSSYDPRTPFVLQKSFIFPARIETLSVTITSRGITPQHVLVGMENGQIFKLNRAFIDPRQPDKPLTPLEQEEGLIQYTPLVPLHNNLNSMVTYNQTIANLKAIATTPAELESTTLVFAHGLDYFYVRLAPAKAFDVLPQDFNYELLVLLCLGFLSGTYVLKSLTLRKSLNEAWK